ncbi:MAG TPA: lysine-2,3-aminomutase-like protein [Xanthobacteraceae bacterium]|jgi:lysine 2,3-aminomutase|nr:lysine-2,3-aminomutase-like protein [Xanthobacteraceae bacterium]
MRTARKILHRPAELVEAGLVPPERRAALETVAARYAVAITPALAELINPADPNDPIARQFVPDAAEAETRPEERADPIGDDAHSPCEGLVHRYPDRVLLKLVHVCPVYCRFCFRREMVGPRGRPTLSPAAISAALDYIAAYPQIWEVILTGGDPLVLSARRLRSVMRRLAAIEHVKVVRVHTRVPVADPTRITPDLVDALRVEGKATYVVLHANHARELTPAARVACARFVDAGVPMLSQSVLLAGVNDDAETLAALMRALVESRVKPYYLHHADLAPGTAHLRTTIAAGQEVMRALRGRVSGLCQPTYVLDIPGGFGKVPVGPCYLGDAGEAGSYQIEDPQGRRHAYPPEG